ncbi:glycosyltransferase family 39 protein [uncultured Christiangramia sp.]|uniref:glycosyltransferase family 39 protein n=1 Tax=uncultured Christiangramia sp. TaxID=503836 RepID=UPI0026023AD9|nr:glycosyltransferase family 39 protein [uncultured Christiangramia sp.]
MMDFASFRMLKIFGIFLISGVLLYNFYIAETTKYDAYGDAAEYVSLGVSLAKVQKYGHLNFEKAGGVIIALQNDCIKNFNYPFRGHSTWRPPVWPFIIAGIFLIFGYKLSYLVVFKFLIHIIGIYYFHASLKLIKIHKLFCLIGAILYGISPVWQLYSRVFLSEPITFFIMTLWMYFLIKYLVDGKGFLLQAFLSGILILSHPYYIFLPFAIWLILFFNKKLEFRSLILTSLVCGFIVGSWVLRNSVVLETSELVLTTSSGAVMAKGWNEDVISKHTNTKGDLANEGLVLESFSYERKPRNEVQMKKLYTEATLHFIKENPDLIIPITMKKLRSAFNPIPETSKPGILETGRWIFQTISLLAIVYILIISKNKLIKSLTLGLVLSTIAITVVTYSGFRFRVPQAALELLIIMYALFDIFKRFNLLTSLKIITTYK